MADTRKLARIHRVRTLQLGLIRADEARANERAASEAALAARIAELAAAVAPTPIASAGVSFAAAAHYRDKLHQSAAAAAARVEAAEATSRRAAEATRAAKRDQSAVEKLIDRAKHHALRREMRAMEDLPPGKGNRHDPC